MSKQVSFQVKLSVNGNEQVVKATSSVEKLREAVAETKGSVTTAAEAFNAYGFAMRNMRDSIASISSTLNSLTEESRTFGAAMAAANTMAGKSGEDLDRLKDSITALGREIPLTRDELAQGLYQVISNGVPEDNWIEYLEKSAKASVGGIADLGETVKVTSTIIKNYGLTWDAAGEIQDKIQLAAKNGVTSFEQMADALPRVAANAATLGVTTDELMATFATLTGVSGNTAETATQLAAVFSALVKPSSEAAKVAEAMGIQFDAAAIKAAGGMQVFLEQLDADVKRYSKATGVLEQEVYGSLFGSAEALRALIPLTGELASKFDENVAAMEGSAGTIDAAFKTMSATGRAQLQTLKNKFAEVGDAISGTVGWALPYINFASGAGMAMTSAITLTKGIQSLAAGQNVLTATTLRSTIAHLAFMTDTKKAAQAVNILSAGTKTAAANALILKAAIRGLMIATAVGAAIVALTAIIEGLMSRADGAVEATKKMTAEERAAAAMMSQTTEAKKRAAEAAADLTGKFAALTAEWQTLKTEGEKREFIKANKTAFEELGLHIETVNDAYEALVENAPKVISALEKMAAAEAYKDVYKASIKDKATGYDNHIRYAKAKEGDRIQVGSEETLKAGITLGDYEGTSMTTGRLTKRGAQKLNQYRYDTAAAENKAELRGYDERIAEARKRMQEAIRESLTAEATLANNGKRTAAAPSTTGTTQKTATPKAANTAKTQSAREEAYKESAAQGRYYDYQQLSGKAQNVQARYNVGITGKADAEEELSAINEMIKALGDGAKPISLELKGLDALEKVKGENIAKKIGVIEPDVKIDLEIPNLPDLEEMLGSIANVDITDFESVKKSLQSINDLSGTSANGFEAAGAAMQGLGSAMQQLGSDSAAAKAGLIMCAIGQVAMSFGKALASTSTWVEWLAFGITGVAQMMSIISTLTGFATGGIVGGGETQGDKKFVRVNSGEMILNRAQQARLYAIITGTERTANVSPTVAPNISLNVDALGGSLREPTAAGGAVEFRLRGRDIVGSMAATTQVGSKSGKRTNIKL